MSFDKLMYEIELKEYHEYSSRLQDLIGIKMSLLDVDAPASYEAKRNDLQILFKGVKYLAASMGHDPENV